MKSAQAEYRLQKKVNKIDPHHLFTLCVWQICPITLSKELASQIVEKNPYLAQIHPNGPKYKAQIISDYGGSFFLNSLQATQGHFEQSSFPNLFIRIMFFIENMARMNHTGLFHFDIKENNVLYNFNRNLIMMIDYGFVSHSVKQRIKPFLTPKYMGGGVYNVPPEMRLISGILYEYKLARALKTTKKSLDFTYANRDLIIHIFNLLASFLPPPPNIGKTKPGKKYFQMFTRFSKWYQKPGDDALFMNINGHIYDKILKAILLYARNRNKTPIYNIFDKKIMKQRFESWSMGFLLFPWFVNMYSYFKKYTTHKKVIEYMLDVICNDLIQSDVSKRLSMPQVFNKINSFLKKNYPTLYKDCKIFSRQTKKIHSQMEWCTHTKS
jgi:serine/threonine protein kinase